MMVNVTALIFQEHSRSRISLHERNIIWDHNTVIGTYMNVNTKKEMEV
jgi:hypothetical protein